MSCLTRKQKWRKCRIKKQFAEKEFYSHIFSSPEWEEVLPRSSQRPVKSESWSHPRRIFGQGLSADACDLKKVNFDDNVRVVLIPSHRDYDGVVPSNTMWWTRDDYEGFKEHAIRILDVYGSLSARDEENINDVSKGDAHPATNVNITST